MTTQSHNEAEEPVVLAEAKYFTFVRQGNWEYIQPRNFTGVVLIVPITDDGKVVLIEQYRVPVKARVIEIPAGLIGDKADFADEDHLLGAKRELHEETGYEADRMELLSSGAPSAGSNSVMLSIFKATGLRKTGDGGGDHTEDITVHEVPLPLVRAWLEKRRAEGNVIDLKVYAGLYLAGITA
ncbi:MAG: NUDIX hydrolase [Phycisphaerae bacterium]|nr:NUDIX hydrolase [Phycisphaerae bacterium]